MELRNGLASQFDVELPASLALDYPSTAAIAAHVASLLGSSEGDDSDVETLQRAANDLSDFSISNDGGVTVVGRPAAAALHSTGAAPAPALLAVADRRAGGPPAAIVGLSARYPSGADDAAGYWNAISTARDLPHLVSAPLYRICLCRNQFISYELHNHTSYVNRC